MGKEGWRVRSNNLYVHNVHVPYKCIARNFEGEHFRELVISWRKLLWMACLCRCTTHSMCPTPQKCHHENFHLSVPKPQIHESFLPRKFAAVHYPLPGTCKYPGRTSVASCMIKSYFHTPHTCTVDTLATSIQSPINYSLCVISGY